MLVNVGLIRQLKSALTVPPGSTIALGFDSGSLANTGSLGGSALYSANSGLHWGRDGVVQGHNLFLNSATGATQSITLVAAAHTLSFKGTGSVAIGGTGSGSLAGTGASDRVSLVFTPTAGSVSFTVTGSITEVVVCRGAYQSYIPTTSAAVYLPRTETSGASGGCVFGPEMSGTNLLTYSQDFSNAAWNKANVTSGTLVTAPDGTTTATPITATSGNSVHYLYQTLSTAFPASTAGTFSIYLKAGTWNYVTLCPTNDLTSNFSLTVNLSTGQITKTNAGSAGTYIASSCTSAGNDWWKVTITGSAASTFQYIVVQCASSATPTYGSNGYQASWSAAGTETFYIWGAQLETGTVATTYIPTLAATVTRPQEDLSITGGAAFGAAAGTVSGWVNVLTGSPWLDTTSSPWLFGLVSSGTNNMVGLYKSGADLVAKTTNSSGTASTAYSAHNLVTYSQDFSNVDWAKAAATITADATAAPDGTLTADKLIESTATTFDHYTLRTNFGTIAGSCTYSVYAKASERRYLQLAGVDNGIAFRPIFDLLAGTVISTGGVSAFIESVGGGWYRCGWTKSAAALNQITAILQNSSTYQSYTGDGTSGIYLWGAQLNLGSAATTYVPTTTAAVHTTGLVSGWNHLAMTYDATALNFYLNGSLVTTASSPNIPSVIGTTAYIGADYAKASASQVNAPIDSIHTYPTALTAAQITALYKTRK